jgi:hypothetical protein
MTDWIYGCYLGNHKTKYRWECKKFESEPEATSYAIEGRENNGLGPTMVVEVPQYMPEIFHSFVLNRLVKRINHVKINS